MKARDLHPVIREALAVFETLRKIGFSSDDIFAGRDPSKGSMFMQLKTQGLEFTITLDGPGNNGWSPEALTELWTAAGKAYNGNGPDDFTDTERQDIWEHSGIRRNAIPLMYALVAKGIALPSGWRGSN